MPFDAAFGAHAGLARHLVFQVQISDQILLAHPGADHGIHLVEQAIAEFALDLAFAGAIDAPEPQHVAGAIVQFLHAFIER